MRNVSKVSVFFWIFLCISGWVGLGSLVFRLYNPTPDLMVSGFTRFGTDLTRGSGKTLFIVFGSGQPVGRVDPTHAQPYTHAYDYICEVHFHFPNLQLILTV